jgi:hypothetical protein
MRDTRQHAHELIDLIPEPQLSALVGFLETFVCPDETGGSLSNAERNAVAKADEWLKHNEPIPHEEVLAELGLTMADWEEMGREP